MYYTIGGCLYHHGILGMRWGVKNGPPYPLEASSHNASERKAGYKKSIGGGSNEELYDRKRKNNNKRYNTDYKKIKAERPQQNKEKEPEKTRNLSEILDDVSKKAVDMGVEKAVFAAAGISLAVAISSPASSAIIDNLAKKGKDQLAAKVSNITNIATRRLKNGAVASAQAAGVALVASAIAKGSSKVLSKKMERDKKELSSEEYEKRYNNQKMRKISRGYAKAEKLSNNKLVKLLL